MFTLSDLARAYDGVHTRDTGEIIDAKGRELV